MEEQTKKYLKHQKVLTFIKKGRLGGGAYFKDGSRKAHYVLVLTLTAAYTNNKIIGGVIRRLEDTGLEFEQALGITIPVIFIKIHLPDEVAVFYLETYGIHPEFLKDFDYVDHSEAFSTFKTPLHKKNVFKDVKVEHLSLTKVKIIDGMLSQISLGVGDKKGIRNLVKQGIIQDHYALHDGNIQYEYWYNDDLLNDRTLLAKYWANYNAWFKVQPLDLINKYYGSEVAFYFAWSEYFNWMITAPAIMGIIVVITASADVLTNVPSYVMEVCNSTFLVCGLCIKEYGCAQTKLKTHCEDYMMLAILEYPFCAIYATAVCIWAIIFIKMWQRKEYILKVRWNLLEEYADESIQRVEYEEKAKKVEVNGKIEYKLSTTNKYFRITGGIFFFVFLLFVITAFMYLKQYVYLEVKIRLIKAGYEFNTGFFMSEIHSYPQAIFTILFSNLVIRLVLSITQFITPRTQDQYAKILMVLTFSLDLANNLFPLLHTAFLKDLQFNVPYAQGVGVLKHDACDPLPCIIPLFVQVMVLMTLKVIIEKVAVICYPKLKKIIQYYLHEQLKKAQMPQYEEEYGKYVSSTSLVDNYYSPKVIQYLMIIAFIYGFPLAPACTLIHNVLALRMEAIKLIYSTRRPALTRKIIGIGDWGPILMAMTLLGSVINIFLIGFAGDFIDLYISDNYHDPQASYIRYSYSEFEPHEVFGPNRNQPKLPNECLFRGDYLPPSDPLKYTVSDSFWSTLTMKLKVIMISEWTVIIGMYLFGIIIPTIPLHVKKKLFLDRTNLQNKYNSEFNKELEIIHTLNEENLNTRRRLTD